MKKLVYVFCGFIVGVVFMASGEAFATQIKSLIGQKVSGELNVIINGEKLQEKGAVINGRTNAPVRAISDAIGGELKLDKDTVYITTSQSGQDTSEKDELLTKKKRIEDSITELTAERDDMEQKYNENPNPGYEGALKSYVKILEDKEEELEKINEALKAFE